VRSSSFIVSSLTWFRLGVNGTSGAGDGFKNLARGRGWNAGVGVKAADSDGDDMIVDISRGDEIARLDGAKTGAGEAIRDVRDRASSDET